MISTALRKYFYIVFTQSNIQNINEVVKTLRRRYFEYKGAKISNWFFLHPLPTQLNRAKRNLLYLK